MSNILDIRQRRPEQALESLNRLTGLDFQHWPESLVQPSVDGDRPSRCEQPVFVPEVRLRG